MNDKHHEWLKIEIVPLGPVADSFLHIIAAHVTEIFKVHTTIQPALPPPHFAFDPLRKQYDAGRIINHLEEKTDHQNDKTIAVCTCDLFVPILTYVFGEARQNGRCAVISLCRLETDIPPDVPKDTAYLRAVKIALHEIGHLFNLLHCEDELCLMHFRSGLDLLDRAPIRFCRYCLRAVHSVRL